MDEISFILHSSTGVREMSTHVTTLVGATDLTIQVADSSRITRGLVELGDELIVVDDESAVERLSNPAAVAARLWFAVLAREVQP